MVYNYTQNVIYIQRPLVGIDLNKFTKTARLFDVYGVRACLAY